MCTKIMKKFTKRKISMYRFNDKEDRCAQHVFDFLSMYAKYGSYRRDMWMMTRSGEFGDAIELNLVELESIHGCCMDFLPPPWNNCDRFGLTLCNNEVHRISIKDFEEWTERRLRKVGVQTWAIDILKQKGILK